MGMSAFTSPPVKEKKKNFIAPNSVSKVKDSSSSIKGRRKQKIDEKAEEKK